ncbi:Rex2 protein [Maudiozyma humilis]|uniref:Rex2 protein n=1 Tax=Maudiozyma humilis TaxID=51915 RepID=A0AAV5RXM8_MAUHU|nr:Rex2 protein [Kazachstania humilis]
MLRSIFGSVQRRFAGSPQARSLATNAAASATVLKDQNGKISKPIVWIDCEMTGLDHKSDHIIEICCIITDGNLNIVDQKDNNCYESVVHYDKDVMDKMGEWCVEHHGSSGLTAKVLASSKTREQVEDELLAYIKKFIPDQRVGILAGNSIHMDRLFMLKEFPKVIDHLFYRLIDVSTIMEVGRRFNPDIVSVFPKKETAHTAKKDILESIGQLRWYTEHYLKSPRETAKFVASRRREEKAEADRIALEEELADTQRILDSLHTKRDAEEEAETSKESAKKRKL